MRHITKRLTCVNRNNGIKNESAIISIVNRYIDKMREKGWELEDPCYPISSSGNSMFRYEAYVHMCK